MNGHLLLSPFEECESQLQSMPVHYKNCVEPRTVKMSWMEAVKAAGNNHWAGNNNGQPQVTSSTDNFYTTEETPSEKYRPADKICINRLGGSYCSGRPLPIPMREKIVELAKMGMKPCQISKQLRVSHGCVSKLLARWRKTGSIQPERIGGSAPKRVLPYVAAAIKVYKRWRPDFQTWQIRQRLMVDGLCTSQTVPSISSINKCIKMQSAQPNMQIIKSHNSMTNKFQSIGQPFDALYADQFPLDGRCPITDQSFPKIERNIDVYDDQISGNYNSANNISNVQYFSQNVQNYIGFSQPCNRILPTNQTQNNPNNSINKIFADKSTNFTKINQNGLELSENFDGSSFESMFTDQLPSNTANYYHNNISKDETFFRPDIMEPFLM